MNDCGVDDSTTTPGAKKKEEERKRRIGETSPEQLDREPKKYSEEFTNEAAKVKMVTKEEMEKMLEMMLEKSLDKSTSKIMKEMKEIEKSLKADLKEKMEHLEEKIRVVEGENELLMETNRKLEERMESVEKEMKRRNFVVRGLKAEGNEEAGRKVKELVKKLTNDEVKVKNVKIIKTKIGELMMAECESNEQKANLMRQKAKLKSMKGETIYINDDLTMNEREIQRRGREIASKMREEGADVKIGYKKIIKNGKVLWWNSQKKDFVEKI